MTAINHVGHMTHGAHLPGLCERLTLIASDFFHTPVAAITLHPHEHQWMSVAMGFPPIPFHTAYAFGLQAAQASDTVVVPDLRNDARFRNHPLFDAVPQVRFYAGMPLKDRCGASLGALWVVDDSPRHNASAALTQFRAFSDWVRQAGTHIYDEVISPQLQALHTMYGVGLIVQDHTGEICACDPYAEYILGLSAEQLFGQKRIDICWQAIHSDGSPFVSEQHPAMRALLNGTPQSDIMGIYKPNGRLTWLAIRAQPLWRPDELHPYAVISSFLDITQQQNQLHIQTATPKDTPSSAIHAAESVAAMEHIHADLQAALQNQVPFSVVQFVFPSLEPAQAGSTIGALAELLKERLPCTDMLVMMPDAHLLVVMPRTENTDAYRRAEDIRRFFSLPPTPHLPTHTWFAVTTIRGTVIT